VTIQETSNQKQSVTLSTQRLVMMGITISILIVSMSIAAIIIAIANTGALVG
jgi:hypothetical protein